MSDTIYLGVLKQGASDHGGESIRITKHQWDCGWYWSFGYLGNRNLHFHFESFLKTQAKTASELFESTTICDSDWWVIRDLFVQAYALQAAAEVYRHGGHQTSRPGITDMIKNLDMAATLNKDLEKVLDAVWAFLGEATTRRAKGD